MTTTVYRPTLAERLWSRVDRSAGPDACWPWTGARLPSGYGQLWTGTHAHGRAYAHRLAWTVTRGDIPDGLYVLHQCDNPPCCNPGHLFLGTQLDNVQDRDGKGRAFLKKGSRRPWGSPPTRGTAHPAAKLTEDAVGAIIARYRAGGVTQRALAAAYGVNQSIISQIVNGKRWRHVTRAQS